jgi:hypothetical protein
MGKGALVATEERFVRLVAVQERDTSKARGGLVQVAGRMRLPR